jgi:hypothetical protein
MTSTLVAGLLLLSGNAGTAQLAPSAPPVPMVPMVSPWMQTPIYESTPPAYGSDGGYQDTPTRAPFESDHAFPNFIGPISNPVLAKDPRALTEARLLFVGDWIPKDSPLAGGNFQAYGLQVRVALTDRLSFIADKDGILSIHPGAGPSETGFLDMAAGFKYAFVRDVENQFLVTGGLMFEPQMGESKVFQGQGSGLFTAFGIVGKEFGDRYHFIGNAGYQFPVDQSQNSSFFYTSLHLDKQVCGWIYPLVEFNWFHWTTSGDRGLPPSLGEGDGLINFGTSGVAGNDLVTVAVGLKAVFNQHLDVGVAYETPISQREDLIMNRVLAEIILRY